MSISTNLCPSLGPKNRKNFFGGYTLVTLAKMFLGMLEMTFLKRASDPNILIFLNGLFMSIGLEQSIFCVQMTIDMTTSMQNRIPNNFSSECFSEKCVLLTKNSKNWHGTPRWHVFLDGKTRRMSLILSRCSQIRYFYILCQV